MFPPFINDETSYMAALSVEQTADRLRAKVLNHIIDQGENGATDQEIQTALSMPSNSEGPRRWELSTKLGMVVDSGKRRLTRAGVRAIVWVVTRYRGIQ